MIFIKTNDVNDVVFCHTDPFHETYGLGKTAEELRAEGFLVDYLKELPTSEKRKGYRGITCFADNRFWFRYVVENLSIEEQYIEQVSILQEKQATHEKTIKVQQEENALLKQEIEQLGYNVDTSITYAGDAHNKADQTLQETARMTMELMFKEEAIQNQEAELIRQKTLMTEQKKLLDLQKQEIQATIEESAMMTMELMNLSESLEVTKGDILKANAEAKEIKENILQANAEMVRTKEELVSAQENLMLTQSEVAMMLLMMLDERGTVE